MANLVRIIPCFLRTSALVFISLPVAAVSMPGLDFGFRFLLNVLGQGAALIIRLVKLALLISPDITLIGAGIYKFAFSYRLRCHFTLLADLNISVGFLYIALTHLFSNRPQFRSF